MTPREANMADRKGRSVTFTLPNRANLGVLKAAIQSEINSAIVVFQDLGNGEYLIECERKEDAETLVEQGFDMEEVHVCVHPPQGKYVNVSIMGLRSYIDDQDVKDALSVYGEIKSEVVRLKYKADHELAGLQNGNRLVKMVLEKQSIPYSLRIGGEWCKIIHNNQQPVCSECSEVGHTRKRCPAVECRICHELGHMSYNCDRKNLPVQQNDEEENLDNGEEDPIVDHAVVARHVEEHNSDLQEDRQDSVSEDMDFEQKGLKRQHHTDSDSDSRVSSRRPRINPAPNTDAPRRKEVRSTLAAGDSRGRSHIT